MNDDVNGGPSVALLQALWDCNDVGQLSLKLQEPDLERLRDNLRDQFDKFPLSLQSKWGDILEIEIPPKAKLPDWKVYQRYQILDAWGYNTNDAAPDLGMAPAGIPNFRMRYDSKAQELGFDVPKRQRRKGRTVLRKRQQPEPERVTSSSSTEKHLALATLGLQMLKDLTELNIRALDGETSGQREGS